MAKRFVGTPNGLELQLPPVDDDWSIQVWHKNGLTLSNIMTGHSVLVGFDQIREYIAEPARGERDGLLGLKTQVHISGVRSPWTEPIRVGESVPDQFHSVHGWKRENDAAYIRSLFPDTPSAPVIPQVNRESPALGIGLLCLCVCVGLLIAST